MAQRKKVRILCLDGGGIRGIIPAVVVQYIEKYLQEKRPGTHLADHFDFIAGTSTGGILTALYLTPSAHDEKVPRYSATDALNFYVQNGYSIFNASKKPMWRQLWGLSNSTQYSPKRLEELLAEKFGKIKINEMIKPCLITTYNLQQKSAFFFTRDEDLSKRQFYVKDVLRSTSAAPTYFPPAEIKNLAPFAEASSANMVNLDGGVFANNPSMCAYAEARTFNFEDRNNENPTAKDMYILSIGTGGGSFTVERINKISKWSLLTWAKLIPTVMMDGSIDTVDYQMKRISESLSEEDQGDYMRIDYPDDMPKNYSANMAECSPENNQALVQAGEITLTRAIANGLNTYLDHLLDEQPLA